MPKTTRSRTTTRKSSRRSAVARPGDDVIKAFLQENPNYLARHPKILKAIAPKRRNISGTIADFQSVLLDRQRHENDKLAAENQSLIATSRANLTSQGRIHAGALALLEARSFNDLIQAITTDLAVKLDVDVIRLVVEDENSLGGRNVSGVRMVAAGSVDRLMDSDRDIVLNTRIEGSRALYGSAAGLVASEALLRLHASPDSPPGILALGSRQAGRFDPGQGTELLGFLARILELCIRTWLGLPRK